ncbi:SURF1 family protein [Reyranella sp. MMS21-HV4-11]|uniref:SURF1-like protein n=1 Tax=Reyranella humidisoli TaxID=2849149 RepID=A0ABS6IHX5_9HYPH|nr:SURF1 family protein [Reyranella sp. MMS21-HV4-11]MBU8873936.1 SURF1 family protein [Reyranella sp. MMS21-HV4-11]
MAGFAALGVWQLERRAWKLELIDRVERRIHAEPAPVPGPEAWPSVDAAGYAYHRVRLSGRYLHDSETLVQAVTELGAGYWVLTPMVTLQGTTVLVNRGFVAGDRRDPGGSAAGNPAQETQVTGLLRITEPGGGFLRRNDPAAGRWYSRDVTAIAAARGLADVAPYFVDADASSDAPGGPRGGLTVVAFTNHHLIYALTWFVLAIMAGGAGLFMLLPERRR